MLETNEGILGILLHLLPGGLWCAWWFLAVDWKKVWPVLASGGWVVVLLLGGLVTLVWAGLFPRPLVFAGLRVENFWWQLLGVAALTAAGLLCGWLQEQVGWVPPAVFLEPPAEDTALPH